ncbi:MAG TPA: glycosyltransferase [Mycobacteriales bacterium]|nr:glycosyltransferase [Mycobacteriales bacterium]
MSDLDTDQASPRVLYLAGVGRSGSTLLERMLGQVDGVCSVGELAHLWARGVRDNELCGCGRSFGDCPFWSKVGEVAFGGWNAIDTGAVLRLQQIIDEVGRIPLTLTPRLAPSYRRAQCEYQSLYEKLCRAISEVSGSVVVIDASKRTGLGYALRSTPGIQLRFLHVIRDSRAVAFSWTKRVRRPEATGEPSYMPTFSPARTAFLWSLHSTLVESLRFAGGRVMRLRYEDFIDSPRAELARVLAFAGASTTTGLGFLDADRVRLESTHTVAGNPMRFHTGEIPLRRDDAWRRDMPERQAGTVSVLTWPLRRIYGYGSDTRCRPRVATAALTDRAPSVNVVLPTRDRPALLRRALASILAQDYIGDLTVTVVFDRTEPDRSLEQDVPGRSVRVVANDRTPGLCGARNTGILAETADLVAFCDDDDEWSVDKLTRQVARLEAVPEAEFCSTGMVVDYDNSATTRLAGVDTVGYDALLRSRMAMLHSSSFLMRRSALLDGIGLMDEDIPGGMCEDWDLLLRASRRRSIVHVDEPLVRVLWSQGSYFSDQWQLKNEAHEWMLDRHPDIRTSPVGAGRVYGQLAFGHAALANRRESMRWSFRAVRSNWREPRAYLALLVATGLISDGAVLRRLHVHGRGV